MLTRVPLIARVLDSALEMILIRFSGRTLFSPKKSQAPFATVDELLNYFGDGYQ